MIEAAIEDGKLVLTMPIFAEPQASKSGKSMIVATTRGAMKTDAKVNGQSIIVNCSAYVQPKPEAE